MIRLPHDLLLTLAAPDPDGRVRVTLTQGEDSAELAVGETPLGSANRAAGLPAALRDFPAATITEAALTDMGRALAELALPPSVRDALRVVLAASGDAVSPVRLRLTVAESELAGLPWEFLHLGESWPALSGFLGLHPRLRLVRESPEHTAPSAAAAPVVGPVRVLLAHADPRAPGYPALSHLPAEVSAVCAALATPECRRVEVRPLAGATPASLRRSLREWEPHILHLIGHGDSRPSGGVLVLQGERDGSAAFVYADELAEWLRGTAVRLVVLSACRTASPVGGAARSLSAAGVPAVVAMQFPLRDAAAGLFSRAFYAALLEACAPEEAVAQARQAVRGIGPDWGVPVLYLHRTTGPLFARPTSGGAAAPLPPTNLPYRRAQAFVGREALIAEIHRSLSDSRDRTVALVGMGGLGKTQTAVEYAHTHGDAYPGGVFWINARDARTLEGEYAALGGRFFGVPAALPPGEGAQWTQDALARAPLPTLLIFDNVTAETDLHLLPTSGHCRVLLTTRAAYLSRGGFRALAVPVLDEESSLVLLQSHQSAEGQDEEKAVGEIAEILGRLPLALALAAHHVHRLGVTFRAYVGRLTDAPLATLTHARKRFVAATGHDGGLFDALALSRRSLLPDAVGVLNAASAFAAHDIPTDLLAQASALPDATTFEEAVADLVDSSWVTREGDGRLGVHELVRLFLREDTPAYERGQAVARAAALLTRSLGSANDSGDWHEVRRDVPHAFSAAQQCRMLRTTGSLAPLLYELGRYSFEHSDLQTARTQLEEGLAAAEPGSLLAAKLLRSLADVLDWLNVRWADAGRAGRVQGGLPGARRALSLAKRVLPPWDPELAEFYNTVGLSLRRQDRLTRALRFYERALRLNEAGPQPDRRASTLINIGALHEARKEPETALRYLDEAIALLAAEPGAKIMEAMARDNIGRILSSLERWEEALQHHRQALSIHEASFGRQHSYVAASLYYSAVAEHGLALYDDARRDYREALLLYQKFFGDTNDRCTIVRKRLSLLPPHA